jgi:hypothetical protein
LCGNGVDDFPAKFTGRPAEVLFKEAFNNRSAYFCGCTNEDGSENAHQKIPFRWSENHAPKAIKAAATAAATAFVLFDAGGAAA